MTTDRPSAPLALPAIDLETLDRTAALRTRFDRKYVVASDSINALVAALGPDLRALEIGGERVFTYRNLYYDSAGLDSYRAHVQGRRRRFKVRLREYVETGRSFLEVKLRGARGQTVKRRLEIAHADTADAETVSQFVDEVLRVQYGQTLTGSLEPALAIEYRRLTLVAPAAGERITADFALTYERPTGGRARLQDDRVIVETKTPRQALGPADRELHRLGARPLRPLSKYLLGIGLTTNASGTSDFSRVMRRHFTTDGRLSSSVSQGR